MNSGQMVICILPLLSAVVIVFITMHRSASQVAADLRADTVETDNSDTNSLRGYTFGDQLSKAGLLTADERRHYLLISRVTPFVLASLVLGSTLTFTKLPTLTCVVIVITSIALGTLITASLLRGNMRRYEMRLAFFLPVVMERVVMAVEAGLDVLPALSVVADQGEMGGREIDPVSRLLKIALRLNESGVGVEQGLAEIGRKVESRPVRHAFMHLALAQKEGGELLMPLRELSDATQAYFQETIEERIARLPARATLPLLCTFAGLIICFLVPPLLQVLDIMERSMPR